jgi:hypothetical protein
MCCILFISKTNAELHNFIIETVCLLQDDAVETEKGLASNPIEVTWVSSKPSRKPEPAIPTYYAAVPPEVSTVKPRYNIVPYNINLHITHKFSSPYNTC